MTLRSVLGRVALVLLVALLVAMAAGQALGQPVGLSYVQTGSMAPVLQPGDGFVVVPRAVAGPIETGDVVVFDAEELNGGGLVTHRVVGRTEGGFITKGDANPVTDQSSGEPPVSRPRIVGKALEVGGRPLVIPGLGLAVTGVQGALSEFQRSLATALGTRLLLGTRGLVVLLGAAGVVGYAVLSALERSGERSRTTRRGRHSVDAGVLIAVFVAVVVVFATTSMVLPSGTHRFDVVSSRTDAPGAEVIEQGTTEVVTFRVPSNGLVPVVVFLEPAGDGITVGQREVYVPPLQERTVAVELEAPARTGYYRRYLTEHRYIAILPRGMLRSLYEVHPWLPIAAIDALFAAGLTGLGIALIGLGPVRLNSNGASLSVRLRRRLR